MTPGGKPPGVLGFKDNPSNLLVFSMQVSAHKNGELAELIRLECRAFAAKIRAARAILGWSQSELGFRVGLTQRAVHKLEQGETEPRRATARAMDDLWIKEGIEFEDLADGGFRVSVRSGVLDRAVSRSERRQHTRISLSATAGSLPS